MQEPRCTGETAKFQSRGRWSFLATPQTRRGKREKCQSSAVCPCPHSLELSAQSDTISQNTCVGGVWVLAAFNYHVKLIYHVVKQTSTVTPMSIWLRQTRWNTFYFFFCWGLFLLLLEKSQLFPPTCHLFFFFFLKRKWSNTVTHYETSANPADTSALRTAAIINIVLIKTYIRWQPWLPCVAFVEFQSGPVFSCLACKPFCFGSLSWHCFGCSGQLVYWKSSNKLIAHWQLSTKH